VTRLLVIMGSGETSPTMVKVHRELFARLAPGPAVLLDTPFGFQENADDIAAKAVAYFRESVGRDVAVASFRSADEAGSLAYETAMTRLREAAWVFSGPGSPSYALRHWRSSAVPGLLADKLRHGGCVTFASAAAATLGRRAVPVYEIYKVGEAPFWLDGLDLLTDVGLAVTVIPHFNNAEGGHHDTRYCYLGERRLAMLEERLGDDEFVLGVDEHTAAVLDLDASSVAVAGLGGLTVRARGRMARVEAGESVSFACLRRLAATPSGPDVSTPPPPEPEPSPAGSPLLDDLARLEREFTAALAGRDATRAVGCVLELDDLLVAWSRDTLQSDQLDRGRAALRAMVVRLGEAAVEGVRDPKDVVGPFVDALLEARRQARDSGRWSDADALRDRLVDAGIEVQDTRDGTVWRVR
jgi:cyanophycinase-like exopeptidase